MNTQPRLCACGCGNQTGPAVRGRNGYSKGEPTLFLRGHIGGINSKKLYEAKLTKDASGRTSKLCTHCKAYKPLSEFNKSRTRFEHLRAHCKACEREQANAYYKLHPEAYKRRAAVFRRNAGKVRVSMINSIKTEFGCAVCPENMLCALDFHHVTGRGMPVARAAHFSNKQLRKELSKCIVLCANCHRKVHAGVIVLNESQKAQLREYLYRGDDGRIYVQ